MIATYDALQGWSYDPVTGHYFLEYEGVEVCIEPLLLPAQFYIAVYDTQTKALLGPKVVAQAVAKEDN